MVNRTILTGTELAKPLKGTFGQSIQDPRKGWIDLPGGINLCPYPPPAGVGIPGTVWVQLEQAERVAAVYPVGEEKKLWNGMPVKVKFIDGIYEIDKLANRDAHEALGGDPLPPNFLWDQHGHTDAQDGGPLGDNTVGSAQLQPSAVGTDELAPTSVTQPKLANSSVGSAQLIDNDIAPSKLVGLPTGGFAESLITASSFGFTTRRIFDTATTDPGPTNDQTEGYRRLSLWLNESTDTLFICLDATEDNAVWVQIYPTLVDWGSPSSDIGADNPVGVEATNILTGNLTASGDILGSYANINSIESLETFTDTDNSTTVNTTTVNASGVLPTTRLSRPSVTPSVANGDMGYGSNRAMTLIAGRVNYESSAMATQPATTLCQNTAAETALLTSITGSITTPASFFNAGRALRIVGRGALAIASATPVNLTWRLYLGATVIWGLTIPYNFVVTSAHLLNIDILCYTTGASATIQCNGNFDHHNIPATSRFDANFTPFNVNTAASNTFSLTAQWSTASNNYGLSLRQFKLLMEM